MVGAEPVHDIGGHVEVGVRHAEGPEQSFVEKLIQGLAAHALDQLSQDVGREAVVPAGAGLEQQRNVGEFLDEQVGVPDEIVPVVDQAGFAICPVDWGVADVAVAQPRGVQQEVLGSHRRVDGNDFVALVGGLVLPLREEPRDRFVEVELAVVDEHQCRGAGDRLRHRVDADQRVEPHRRAGLQVECPGRMFEDDLAASHDHRGHANQLAVGHQPVHLLCDGVHALLRHSYRLRRRPRQFSGTGVGRHRGENQCTRTEQFRNPLNRMMNP